ncbi:MAG TPA: SDR family oxidoreductase [Chryseosolibacter sp.]|nr:SDR family oxidoreductase [Chryseosolibacter sp.]
MEKNKNKKDQYALVTGGTSGIGYEIAKLLAKDGYNLVLVARSNERLLEASDEFQQLGVDVHLIDKDLFDPAAAREVFQEVKAKNITVDVLINNAAQGQKGAFHDVPLERHLELIQLNITSLITLTRLFLGEMVSRNHGKILNLASVVSKTPAPEFSIYAASKAFVLSFSEAIAHELEETGITITALLPGRTDTDFFFKADMTETKEFQDHQLADPAVVAKDGYDALMSGKSRVISGLQNKAMVGMMNTMPDASNAEKMHKNMQPTEKPADERRGRPTHAASEKERDALDKEPQQ